MHDSVKEFIPKIAQLFYLIIAEAPCLHDILCMLMILIVRYQILNIPSYQENYILLIITVMQKKKFFCKTGDGLH